MGGGIVLRYAALGQQPAVEGYLQFAPHLGSNAATSQPRAGVEATGEPFVKVHLGRTLGLVMLNAVHITALNHLDTLYFNLSEGTANRRYSYRAMAGAAPGDYRAALIADSVPMLVVVGQRDEVFQAEEYPDVIGLHSNSRTVISENADHSGVLKSPVIPRVILDWFASLERATGHLPDVVPDVVRRHFDTGARDKEVYSTRIVLSR